jgi:hypothetical protein
MRWPSWLKNCAANRKVAGSIPDGVLSPYYGPVVDSASNRNEYQDFLGSLKTVYAAEANKWMHNHPGLGIPQSDICLFFRNAYEKVSV